MEDIVDGFEFEWEAKAPSVGRHDLGDRSPASKLLYNYTANAGQLL